MSRRISTLQDINAEGNRDVTSKYDNIKLVADNIASVLAVEANMPYSLKYLGASAIVPTQRLDGGALEDGDYYFDTVNGVEGIAYYDLAEGIWVKSDASTAIGAQVAAEAARDAALISESASSTSASEAAASALNIANVEAIAVQAALDAVAAKDLAETAGSGVQANADAALVSENAAKVSEDAAAASALTASTSASSIGTSVADAIASAAAAAISEGLADDDATQTAADRVVTEGNAAQTTLDVAATASDRVQTGLDRTAVSNDKAATAQDALDTAADLALTNADVLTTAGHLASIETIYDNFDDRYLGAFPAEPTLDNDGQALLIGAIYFDTVLNQTKFYNGGSWENPELTATQAAQATAADRAQTALDVAATADDLAATNQDTIYTAADRVQTGLDRAATGADATSAEDSNTESQAWAESALSPVYTGAPAGTKSSKTWAAEAAADVVLTHADVVLTNADASATADDKLATNADVVLTGDDVVLTHADVVLTNADVALTHADVVTTNTNVGLTNADVVLTHADVVLTGDDVDLTNADVVLTHADVVLTAADRVQTGLDVISADDAASISAANANYKGEWASLTGSLSIPASVKDGSSVYMLNVATVVDITLSQPSATPAEWFLLGTIGGNAPDADRLGGELPSFYQEALVSGVNIKTVEGNSILGSGNIVIPPSYDDTAIQAEVDLNTAKVGITTAQANAIIANSAKVTNVDHPLVETAVPVGAVFTDTDTVYDDTVISAAVSLNTAKVGITPQQAADITANNAKVSNVDHPLVEKAVPSNAVFTDTIYDDSAVLKDSDTLSPVNAGNKLMTQTDVSDLGGGDMLASTYDTTANGTVDNAELVNSLTVETAVPPGAVFTDTVYDSTAIDALVAANTAKVGITAQQAADIVTNNAKETNIVHPLVEKAVPSNAVFTDTTYVVGDGGLSEINFTTADNDKLDGIEDNATADQTDAEIRAAVAAAIDSNVFTNAEKTLVANAIPSSEKGANNGVAELDASGLVITSQLPSYVDDVLEFVNLAAFPATGESGKVYIDATTNITYRWSGSNYAAIGSDLALGETSATAYRGDRGKTAYDHSQVTTGNPHGVTAAELGLGNVENTADLDKVVSTATSTALGFKQDNLVSGTNIKTVNGESLLGSTDIVITSAVDDIVIPQTVSGTLIAGGEENQLRDSGTFDMPLAGSVAVNTVCYVTLPDTYSTSTPTINRSGSDLFENEDGTDTSVSFLGSADIRFTSDGTSKWYVDVTTGSRGADGINMPTEIVPNFDGVLVPGTLYIQVV